MKELKREKKEGKGKYRGGHQDDLRDGAALLQEKAEINWDCSGFGVT